MKEYTFYRIISEEEFFLTDFSISENLESNLTIIENIEKVLLTIPFTEKSNYLVTTELNGNLLTKTFFPSEKACLEIFNKLVEMYSETFKEFLSMDEFSLKDRNRSDLEVNSVVENSDEVYSLQAITDQNKSLDFQDSELDEEDNVNWNLVLSSEDTVYTLEEILKTPMKEMPDSYDEN